MRPGEYVVLERIPLTPAGKIDRHQLVVPPLRSKLGGGAVEHHGLVEQLLCAIFGELLEVDEVSVNDDFFELGGHSLVVVSLINRIRDAFEVELSIEAIFDAPTVAGIAAKLLERGAIVLKGQLPTKAPMKNSERLREQHD